MKSESFFLYALGLNGKGGAVKLSEKELMKWSTVKKPCWVHLDLSNPRALKWLRENADLPDFAENLMLNVEESRPLCIIKGNDLLFGLRTINLTPRSEPDDMVFLRLFATKNKLITVRLHPALNFKEISDDFKSSSGPTDINTLIDTILDTTLDKISDTISDIEDNLDELEEAVILQKTTDSTSAELSEILRKAVIMRRFLIPSRDAFGTLSRNQCPWFTQTLIHASYEDFHRMERIMEDIELLADRTRINQEALRNIDLKKSQQNMYMLSVVATLFLPLSFITGLFGMNVGGIPLSGSTDGLWMISLLILFIGLFMLYLFKKLRWI